MLLLFKKNYNCFILTGAKKFLVLHSDELWLMRNRFLNHPKWHHRCVNLANTACSRASSYYRWAPEKGFIYSRYRRHWSIRQVQTFKFWNVFLYHWKLDTRDLTLLCNADTMIYDSHFFLWDWALSKDFTLIIAFFSIISCDTLIL